MEGGLLNQIIAGWIWHAIKKLLNLPFLILKVRYPAIKTMVSFIGGGGGGGGGYSTEFK